MTPGGLRFDAGWIAAADVTFEWVMNFGQLSSKDWWSTPEGNIGFRDEGHDALFDYPTKPADPVDCAVLGAKAQAGQWKFIKPLSPQWYP